MKEISFKGFMSEAQLISGYSKGVIMRSSLSGREIDYFVSNKVLRQATDDTLVRMTEKMWRGNITDVLQALLWTD